MRSEIAKKILQETPEETRIFVRQYTNLVVRINELLIEKGYTQKDLADKMDKKPSEINRWLNGTHNLTLKTLAKLEAELGATLLEVPKTSIVSSEQSSATESKHQKTIYLHKERSNRLRMTGIKNNFRNDFKLAINE